MVDNLYEKFIKLKFFIISKLKYVNVFIMICIILTKIFFNEIRNYIGQPGESYISMHDLMISWSFENTVKVVNLAFGYSLSYGQIIEYTHVLFAIILTFVLTKFKFHKTLFILLIFFLNFSWPDFNIKGLNGL